MRKLKFLRYFIMGSLYLMTLVGTHQVSAADPRTAPIQQPVKLPPQISNVIVNPSSVTGGTTQVVGTVTLNQPAPSGGVLVNFRNSNPSIAAVPPSVVVQPGTASATLVIQTYPVAQNPNVVTSPPSADISAQVGNFPPKLTKLTVLPATLASLALNPTSVPGGSGSTGQVAITGPAPAGGLTVGLSSSAATPTSTPRSAPSNVRQTVSPTTVPQQVTIAPGATSAVFPITTRPVSESTPVNINAAHGPFNIKTATLTILPLGVASILFPNNTAGPYNNAFVQGGQTASGTVVLTSAAPAGGADVKLTVAPYSSNSPSPCTPAPSAPATIQVKSGETSAPFTLSTSAAGGNPNWFTITAAYGSSAVTANVHVNQAQVASLTLPASVKGGTTVQLIITLTGPMGQCPSNVFSSLGRITITNSNTIVAQAPSYVQVPGGGTSATVAITTSAVAQTTAVTIGAYHLWEYDKKVATLTLTP